MLRLIGLKKNLKFKESLVISEATCLRFFKLLLMLQSAIMLVYSVNVEIQLIDRDKKLMFQRKV